jgi:superfamily II DNA or RNA helicase
LKVVVDSRAWFRKEDLTPEQLKKLREILTIIPRKVGDHPGDEPEPLPMFVEDDERIGIPRQYFMERRKPRHDVEINVTEGDHARWAGPLSFNPKYQLRPEQRLGVEEVARKFRTGALGGILRAVPGWGKTVASCAIIEEMKVPTLVVVHKDFLLNQWKERILEFLPEAKIGLVRQNMCDYTGKHIVIAMVHSLAGRQYPDSLYQWPGLVITDECHRIGAATWSPVPAKFPAKWRLGVSATPRRKDGADNVFTYHIGRLLFAAQEKRMIPKVRRVWTNFRVVKTDRFNPNLAPRSLLIRFLTKSRSRNRLIIDQLKKAVQAGRKVLVLSERLEHLSALEGLLLKEMKADPPTTGYYVGGMSEDERKESEKQQVIFATKQYAAEGLDIPPLDTLFLTTPMSDVEQAVGRILRPFHGKKDPIVVDFVDTKVKKFKKTASYRDKYYKQLGVDNSK